MVSFVSLKPYPLLKVLLRPEGAAKGGASGICSRLLKIRPLFSQHFNNGQSMFSKSGRTSQGKPWTIENPGIGVQPGDVPVSVWMTKRPMKINTPSAPQTDLSVGVLAVLNWGPWMACGFVACAAEHFSA